MTKQVFTAILGKLSATFPNAYVDVFLGQAVNTPDVPLPTTPAYLVEFMPVRWQYNVHKEMYEAYGATFRIRHVSETGFDGQKRVLDTTHYDDDATLVRALHRFSTLLSPNAQGIAYPLISNTLLVSSETESEMGNLIITVHTFECFIANTAPVRARTMVEADAEISVFIAANTSGNDDANKVTVLLDRDSEL